MAYRLPVRPETRQLNTSGGRHLGYLEFGEVDSPLVIHNHGGPSSRFEGTLLAPAALDHRLRLVCVDRPGFGASSPRDARTFEDWAEDLIHIAEELGYEQFGVSGWSEGGPWALAAAAYIDPGRLRHVSYVAGAAYGAFGDNSAAPQLSKADALGGRLALHHTLAFRFMYELLDIGAVHFHKSYLSALRKSLNEHDAHLLDDPEIAAAFATAAAECFAQGSEALVQDAELLYRQWPFDVTGIERPVHIWQGSDDHLVPSVINEDLARRMPGAVWHPIEGADHLLALSESSNIFAVAAQELAAGREPAP